LATFYAPRALGDVEFIITEGISTNPEGRLAPNSILMTNKKDIKYHTLIIQPFIKKMKKYTYKQIGLSNVNNCLFYYPVPGYSINT
jgi:hypothetical protein